MERFSFVPNALTILRVFIAFIVAPVYWLSPWAGFFLGAWGWASDAVDGFLARKYKEYGWQTKFGADLDPYADKAIHYAAIVVIIGLLGRHGSEVWIPNAFIVTYDVTIWYCRRRLKLEIPSHFVAKKKTILIAIATGFLTLPTLHPSIDTHVFELGWRVLWAAAVATAIAWGIYAWKVTQHLSQRYQLP